jgi:saxitoxin biosynthesis operon SxtJ-like protein
MHERKHLRSFGLIVGGIFALLGVWPAVWRGQPLRLWSLILGGLLLVLALAWPRSLTHVYRLWMTVGEALGWINTRLILGAIFYLIFTPLGVGMRLRGKDPMRRTLTPEAGSYRVVRQPRPASHMRHQF